MSFEGGAKCTLGQHEAAIADYDWAIQLDPECAEAFVARGHAKYTLGQHEAAIADYDRAVQLDLKCAEAFNCRGDAKYALGQHEAAIADYDRAIELAPTAGEFFLDRGNAKYALKQYEAAIADYDRAIELEPKFALAYDNRGNAKFKLGQYQEAVTDQQKAADIEINNTYFITYGKDVFGKNFHPLLAQLGQIEKETKKWEEVFEQSAEEASEDRDVEKEGLEEKIRKIISNEMRQNEQSIQKFKKAQKQGKKRSEKLKKQIEKLKRKLSHAQTEMESLSEASDSQTSNTQQHKEAIRDLRQVILAHDANQEILLREFEIKKAKQEILAKYALEPNLMLFYRKIVTAIEALFVSAKAAQGGLVTIAEGDMSSAKGALDLLSEVVSLAPIVGETVNSGIKTVLDKALTTIDEKRQLNTATKLGEMLTITELKHVAHQVAVQLTEWYAPQLRRLIPLEEQLIWEKKHRSFLSKYLEKGWVLITKGEKKPGAVKFAELALGWMSQALLDGQLSITVEDDNPVGEYVAVAKALVVLVTTRQNRAQRAENKETTRKGEVIEKFQDARSKISAILKKDMVPMRDSENREGQVLDAPMRLKDLYTRAGIVANKIYYDNEHTEPKTYGYCNGTLEAANARGLGKSSIKVDDTQEAKCDEEEQSRLGKQTPEETSQFSMESEGHQESVAHKRGASTKSVQSGLRDAQNEMQELKGKTEPALKAVLLKTESNAKKLSEANKKIVRLEQEASEESELRIRLGGQIDGLTKELSEERKQRVELERRVSSLEKQKQVVVAPVRLGENPAAYFSAKKTSLFSSPQAKEAAVKQFTEEFEDEVLHQCRFQMIVNGGVIELRAVEEQSESLLSEIGSQLCALFGGVVLKRTEIREGVLKLKLHLAFDVVPMKSFLKDVGFQLEQAGANHSPGMN